MQLSKDHKALLDSFYNSGKKDLSAMDLFSEKWPVGQLEVSTFMQTVSLRCEDEEVGDIMAYIVDLLNLLEYLKDEGYLLTWNETPIKDNTVSCGESSAESRFLPDLAVATRLLRFSNYRMRFSSSFETYRKRGYSNKETKGINAVLLSTLIVLLAVFCGTLLLDARFQQLESQQRDWLGSSLSELKQSVTAISKSTDRIAPLEEQIGAKKSEIHKNTLSIKQLSQQVYRQRLQLTKIKQLQEVTVTKVSRLDSLFIELLKPQ